MRDTSKEAVKPTQEVVHRQGRRFNRLSRMCSDDGEVTIMAWDIVCQAEKSVVRKHPLFFLVPLFPPACIFTWGRASFEFAGASQETRNGPNNHYRIQYLVYYE